MSDPVISSDRSGSCRLAWGLVIVLLGLISVYALSVSGIFSSRLKIALVTSGDTPYWDRVVEGARDAAQRYDIALTVIRPATDVETQSRELEKLISSSRWDGIAVSPISLTRQTVLFGRLVGKTTVVTLDSDLPVSRRLCFVGTDNYDAGRQIGKHIRKILPQGGAILITLGQPDKENTLRRRQGIIDELCKRTSEPLRPFDPLDQPIIAAPYTFLPALVDYSDPQKTTDGVVDALRNNPDLRCVVGLLSYSGPAIVAAIEKQQATDQVKVIGFDVSEPTLKLVEQGKIHATVMQDQYGLGYHAVRILVDNARDNIGGLPMFQQHALTSDLVTRDNLSLARRRLAGENVSLSSGTPPEPNEINPDNTSP